MRCQPWKLMKSPITQAREEVASSRGCAFFLLLGPRNRILWVRYLGNHYFLYRQSEAGNEKYCYELHARSGLRFIIRHGTAKLQHNVASPKPRVHQDLSTHAKEPISLQKASKWAQSHVIVSYDMCSSLGDVGVIAKNAVCDYVVMFLCSSFG
jgi:hypothetical protein